MGIFDYFLGFLIVGYILIFKDVKFINNKWGEV